MFAVSSLENLFVAGDVPVTLRGLDPEDAVQLLADALGRPLEADETEAAVRLTTGLSGVPLEILQLAAVVADRDLSLNTVANDIAPSMADPRAELQSATVDTLNTRERSVLVALAAFGGVAVGIGLLAKYASEPEAGSIVRRLVARGLARGDDLVGWASVDESVAGDEDRRKAAPVIIAWVGEEGRNPREVAVESPAILAVARQDVEAGRYDSVIHLAAATESMLALAGSWGAWESILNDGLIAARAVSDHASEAFFSHQLDVRADMLRPRTLAEKDLAQAMQDQDHLYRTTMYRGEHTAGQPLAHVQDGGPGGGRPKWAVPLCIGLLVVLAVAAVLLMLRGGGDVTVGPTSTGNSDIDESPEEKPRPNSSPTAVARVSPSPSVTSGGTVTLDGSGSTGDGLKCLWKPPDGSEVSLSAPDQCQTTFTAPRVVDATPLTFGLTVTDSQGKTAPDDATITVAPTPPSTPPSTPPVATGSQ